jgi:hypothetical protein
MLTLILDTSAINQCADDPESRAVVAALKSGYHLTITGTSVEEIVSNKTPGRMEELFRFLRPLLSVSNCILPYHVIVEEMVKVYEQNPDRFDWRSVSISFRALEDVITGRLPVDRELAQAQRKFFKSADGDFRGMFTELRATLDERYKEENSERPSLTALLEHFKKDNNVFWTFADWIYERPSTKPSTKESRRKFYDACPPFLMVVYALCIAHFERTIRDERQGISLRAGRNDMFSAVYLPYADIFVTDDEKHFNAFQKLTKEASLSVEVLTYPKFRERILILT